MGKQIECKNCTLGYEGVAVTEDINFTVSSGDYLCILGENGSGKSTLIKALLGLRPVMNGNIEWVESKQGEIGYLPQQTVVQRDFPASVREIVLSGCLGKGSFRPFYSKEDKELADKTMTELGIKDLEKRCYRELSGGQQQRVLLARALCAAGKILLLDEPVTGLDPKAQNDLYELIAKLNKQGITIIMVSHDIHAAVRYASHVLHIGSKKQLFFGTKDKYVNSKLGQSFILSEEAEDNE
ncbi:metal ABC transporter ATP-binding protein [Ruminococcus sp.]|uniref:metal ABC transporter ATP-binding protein n=1 Tax=Ruminococcus sp. TaxID=41978 RepID=UPI0025CCD614|nr:metal ABC transporter ATP-binding protein [Ruminococcus sp.]MBQ8966676.1 metal ABC transporter ATP-binding protein [Ruminococcus sp.]